MTVFPFLAVGFLMTVVVVIWFICALALILIILIQKGRGGGLSAAFGGGMASGILGSKTGDFLTWVTIVLVGVFLTLAVVMAKFYKPPDVSVFDAGTSRRTTLPTEQPRSSEMPSPIDEPRPSEGRDEVGAATSDMNEPGDANLLGG